VRPSQSTTAPLKVGRVLGKALPSTEMRPIASLVDGAIAAPAGIRIAGLALSPPALAGCLGLAALEISRRRASRLSRAL
jgi:hypothetical protein